MLKSILFTLNVFALISLKFIFGGEVSVVQSGPKFIQAGQTFMIEISINKSDREGFAKWQQKLPPGFVASPIETEGATFSFKNQDVKLIWMALPEKETLNIFYEVTADPDLSQDLILDGKFSFIEENERKDVDANQLTIHFGTDSIEEEEVSLAAIFEEPSGDTTSEDLVEQKKQQEDAEEEKSISPETKSIADNSKVSTPIENLVTDEEGIKIQRLVNHLGNAVYRVDLKVIKGENTSFAKVEEYLPEDFTATEIESNDAIFSFKDGVVKFLWMTMPSQNEINLSYQIESHADLLDQVQVHGMYSYLNDGKSTQLEMSASSFTNHYVGDEAELADNATEENESTETIEESNDVAAEITEERVEDVTEQSSSETIENTDTKAELVEPIAEIQEEPVQTEVEEEKITAESIADVPAPETSISYKVQIAAGKNEVKQDYFEKKYALQQKVNIEQHEGWFKYTLGKYSTYKQARDERNELWAKDKGLSGAFVTAYNSGQRITVQEALMISQQKWVP